MNPRQWKYKPSDFSFPALESEPLSLGQRQMNFHQDESPPGCDNRETHGMSADLWSHELTGLLGDPKIPLGHMAVMSLLPGAEEDCGQIADWGGRRKSSCQSTAIALVKLAARGSGVLHPSSPRALETPAWE